MGLSLKAETRHLHSQVEKVMGAHRLFNPEYTLVEYSKHLEKLYKGHSSFEKGFSLYESLFQYPQIINKVDFRANDLRQDLISVESPIPETFPLDLKSDFQWAGAYYVLRGSALGNEIISQKIQVHFNRWNIPSQQFYTVTPFQYSTAWPEFMKMINRLLLENSMEVIDGANIMYGYFLETEATT